MNEKKILKTAIFILFSVYVTAQEPEGMVLIEAGTFTMGQEGSEKFGPAHMVKIDSFYMDIHEVTNAEYALFCEATQNKLPEFWGIDKYKSGPDYPDHPVVGVTSEEARRYAEWKGKRLPTEAEWEFAARGGIEGIRYAGFSKIDSSLARYNHPSFEPGPVPVMSYAPNDYGLYDMTGNVWEWVSDWFDKDYYKHSPLENPTGAETGFFKVFRGGGWHSGPGCNSVHIRNALPQHWVDLAGGFRCVKDVQN